MSELNWQGQIIATPEVQAMLAEVELRARRGVVEEAKKNSVPLAVIAMALGAAGGAMLGKSRFGMAIAGLGMFWAGRKILAAQSQPVQLAGYQYYRTVPYRTW